MAYHKKLVSIIVLKMIDRSYAFSLRQPQISTVVSGAVSDKNVRVNKTMKHPQGFIDIEPPWWHLDDKSMLLEYIMPLQYGRYWIIFREIFAKKCLKSNITLKYQQIIWFLIK